MRKLFYLLLGGLLLSAGFTSCEDDPDNPGDYSIRGSLDVIGISSMLGEEYELVISREFDSTIMRYNIIRDTIWTDKEAGESTILEDTVWYADGTCRYVEMEQIDLSPERDTLVLSLTSNARWTAPTPENPTPRWYALQSNAGGGDSDIEIVISRNGSTNPRRNVQVQYIYTSDSATIYEIPFLQMGRSN